MLPDANGFAVCEEIRVDAPAGADHHADRALAGDRQDPRPRRGRRRLRHQAVLGRRAGGAHQRHLPAPAPRAARRRTSAIEIGGAVVDPHKHELTRKGKTHALSFYEVELLRLLCERAGQPVTREEILEKIWGVPGHAEHPHRRQLRRQAAQEDRGGRRQAAPHRHGLRHRLQAGGVMSDRGRGARRGRRRAGTCAGEPLGVYVHFPFCGVRCPYCDFAVDTRTGDPSRRLRRRGRRRDRGAPGLVRRGGAAGVDLLRRRHAGPVAAGRARARDRGGARGVRAPPTRARWRSPSRSTRARPTKRTCARCAATASTGCRSACRRSTIGCCAGSAATTTRPPGRPAVRAARAAGFDNVSIDLMFGVPGQSLDDWRRAVDTAIALAPEHVSAYALTVERGTAFGSLARAGRLARPDDEAVAAMFEHARGAFAAAGLAPYEISSYARPRPAVAPQPPLLVAQPVPGRGGVGGVVPAARRRDRLALLEPARDRRLPARRRRPATSSGGRRPIWRTRRSGSGYAPPPGSIAPSIAPVMASIPWSVVISKSSAPSAAGWLVVDDVNAPAHPSRRPVRRRGREPAVDIGASRRRGSGRSRRAGRGRAR